MTGGRCLLKVFRDLVHCSAIYHVTFPHTFETRILQITAFPEETSSSRRFFPAGFEASPKLHNPLERGAGRGVPQQYEQYRAAPVPLARSSRSLPSPDTPDMTAPILSPDAIHCCHRTRHIINLCRWTTYVPRTLSEFHEKTLISEPRAACFKRLLWSPVHKKSYVLCEQYC